MVPESVGLEKMLSIKVLVFSVTLVGSNICGRIKFDPRISKEDIITGSSLHFKRSMLKSPSRRVCFFSEVILWSRGLRKSALKEFKGIQGSL